MSTDAFKRKIEFLGRKAAKLSLQITTRTYSKKFLEVQILTSNFTDFRHNMQYRLPRFAVGCSDTTSSL